MTTSDSITEQIPYLKDVQNISYRGGGGVSPGGSVTKTIIRTSLVGCDKLTPDGPIQVVDMFFKLCYLKGSTKPKYICDIKDGKLQIIFLDQVAQGDTICSTVRKITYHSKSMHTRKTIEATLCLGGQTLNIVEDIILVLSLKQGL